MCQINLSLIVSLLLLLVQSLDAVSVQRRAFKNVSLFGIQFVESEQEFFGKVSAIQSIVLQEYVTTAYRVSEMNIEIAGAESQVRIYATELLDVNSVAQYGSGMPGVPPLPASVMGASQSVRDSFAPAVTVMDVVKTYPVTTHARTVEFQLSSREGVQELYEIVRNRWIGMEEEEDEEEEDEEEEDDEEDEEEEDNSRSRARIGNKGLNGVLFIVEE